MSTNAKELTPIQVSEVMLTRGKRNVDRKVRNLIEEMEFENTLLPLTADNRLQQLLKIYRNVKPLLTIVSNLPFIPANWRGAMAIFTQAVEALAEAVTRENAAFKAGKDI